MKDMATLPPYFQSQRIVRHGARWFGTTRDALNGQSSPGTLQVGQQPSKGMRQIPHTSSSGSPFSSVLPVSHCHWAMACHCLTMTFMRGFEDAFVCKCVRVRKVLGIVGPSGCARLCQRRDSCCVLPAASGLPAMSCEGKKAAVRMRALVTEGDAGVGYPDLACAECRYFLGTMEGIYFVDKNQSRGLG
jgi:hypothetical protein